MPSATRAAPEQKTEPERGRENVGRSRVTFGTGREIRGREGSHLFCVPR